MGEEEVFSLDLKTATESPLRTVFGSEFQTTGAEHHTDGPTNRERKCADTTGTVPVPWADRFQ